MPEVDLSHLGTIQTGFGISADVSGSSVRLGVDLGSIRDRILSSAVYSINGVYGASDGSFFIHGSECDSWGYLEHSTALPMNEPQTVYKYDKKGHIILDEDTQKPVLDTEASGIWLTDLCPACQTCDDIYQIKQGIEQLEVLVNMMKDVELHDTETLETNKENMEALCIDGGEHCPNPWEIFSAEQGRQLLQQYITVAHLWNYSVVQNNASFKLEIAPEDTAGFVVQTKRSLPNCDGYWHIRCTVSVSYFAAINDNGSTHAKQDLSVYIPEPNLRFKPFNLEDESQPIVVAGGTVYPSAEKAALNGAGVVITPYPNCTTKIVQTDEIIARIGGTYELSFKILPFINYVIYDKNGNIISIRGGTVDISGHTVDGYVVYDSYVADPAKTVRQQLQSPTKQDYLNAKTAPTGSVPFNNVWQIEVLWEVGRDVTRGDGPMFYTPINTDTSDLPENPVPRLEVDYSRRGFEPTNYFEYRETRLYTCTGVREPNSQALVTGTTVPVDIVIPTPEDEA
jgi:hypothetical protein